MPLARGEVERFDADRAAELRPADGDLLVLERADLRAPPEEPAELRELEDVDVLVAMWGA